MKNQSYDTRLFLGSLNPFNVLRKWLKEALKVSDLQEPWAMTLSTINKKNQPQSRIVLLKKIEKETLIFFTNYKSAKAQDLAYKPEASLLFFWPTLEKQIRIFGRVQKISRKESIKYWNQRSQDSQISQLISQQSQSVPNRKTLELLKIEAEKKFQNQSIPCPSHWGGYRLKPQTIEFWQNRKHRLHDRFLFKKTSKNWAHQRLFP